LPGRRERRQTYGLGGCGYFYPGPTRVSEGVIGPLPATTQAGQRVTWRQKQVLPHPTYRRDP